MILKSKTFGDGINYEIALEILGQELQPFMQAIAQEKNKTNPSQDLINYCNTRLKALDELQDALRPNDTETIRRVLNKDDPLFLRK